jgi:hypothetical protein
VSDGLEFRPDAEQEDQSERPLVDGLTIAEAICEAEVARNTLPLAHCIGDPAVRSTLTDEEWDAIAITIAALGKTQTAGNPYSLPNPEVREGARWVDEKKKSWRTEHVKERMRPANDLIQKAIDRIAERRGVVIVQDSVERFNLARQIANALKARRF